MNSTAPQGVYWQALATGKNLTAYPAKRFQMVATPAPAKQLNRNAATAANDLSTIITALKREQATLKTQLAQRIASAATAGNPKDAPKPKPAGKPKPGRLIRLTSTAHFSALPRGLTVAGIREAARAE